MSFHWMIPPCIHGPAWLYFTVCGAATLLSGFSKGGFGGGLGVIATPMMFLVLPANVALSMMLPLLIVCDLFTLRHFPGEWDPSSLKTIAAGTSAGLLIGLGLLLLLARGDVNGERWLRLMVGTVALVFCAVKLWRTLARHPDHGRVIGRVGGTGIGLVAGVTTMIAHAAGPFVDMFLLLRRLDRRRFVGTAARYYLLFNTVKVPLFLLASVLAEKRYMTFETLKWSAVFVPLCPVGVAAGAWMNKRISGELFTRAIYVLLFVTGARMLWIGLGG
jgi:uncharacterized protein